MADHHTLVVGLGISGAAVARAVARRGGQVVVVEDDPGEAARNRAEELTGLGVEVVERPGRDGLGGIHGTPFKRCLCDKPDL